MERSATLLALSPLRAILRLAAPTTLVMLMASASNVLYTYYVSRLGDSAIAAVSLVFPVTLLAITAMGGGIGAGASSAVARSLGARNLPRAALLAENALWLAAGFGIAFALFIAVAAAPLFYAMGGRGEVHGHAVTFSRILFGGAIIQFTGMMLDSILRAEGNVRVASVCSTFSIVLQIALTPFFMFVLDWQLPGAAIAMVVSQLIATVPRALYVFSARGTIRIQPSLSHVSASAIREILRVGIPASLSTVVTYGGVMMLTGVVARFGDQHLAAFGLGTRLDFLLMSFGFGIGTSVLTMVGMTTGAGAPERTQSYVRAAMAIVVVLLAVPSAVLAWDPLLWIHLFSTAPDIEATGTAYFRIIGPSYPFLGIAMVNSFAFQGIGRAIAPFGWVLLRVSAVVGASLYCTGVMGLGEHSVFTAIAVGNVLSAVVMTVLFNLVGTARPAGS